MNIKTITRLLSDENLTKKASLNAIASILDYGASLIVGFLVQPALLIGLGDFNYGVWQVLLRLIGYLSPAGGRPTQALKMTLANQQNIATEEQKRRYVGSAVAVWAIFLPVIGTLGGLLTWFVPYWVKAPSEYHWAIRSAAAVLVMNLIASNLVSVPQSVLQGENMGYKRMGLSALLVLFSGGLTWLAVWLQTGIIGVAGAVLITTLITGVFFLWVTRSFASWFGIARPSSKAIREFLGLSWWFLAWNLIMNLMTASDVVILGVLLSVEKVTDYSLSKYAPETLISLVAIMAFGIAPGLGGIIGTGKHQKAAQVRGEIMALTWLIVTVLGSTVLLWNRSFIGLWVGNEHFVGSLPNLLIVLVVMQFVLIRNDGNVIDLSLRLQRKVIIGGISVGLSLLIAAVLVSYAHMGIVGLSLGLLIGRSILSVSYPVLVGRLLEISFASQLKSIIRPVIVTLVLFLFATGIDNFILSNAPWADSGWIILGLRTTVSFILMFLLAFYIGLTGNQRKNIYTRIRAITTAAVE
jgi:O-antigen/teichoic acid export membrane protein